MEVLIIIIKTTDDCQLASSNSVYLCCHKTMFRFSVILVLLVAFTAQSFQRSLIMLQYYSNTAAFAEKCENKARPQMQCHGKCQMVKKIAAAEKQQQQTPDKNLNNKVETLSFASYFCTAPSITSATITASFPPYSCGAAVDLAYPVFHPPA